MAVAAPAMLLMSPHAMFYDSALVAISVGVLVASGPIQRIRAGAVVWLVGLSHVLATTIGFSPLFFMAVAVWLWALSTLVRAEPPWQGPRPGGIIAAVRPPESVEQISAVPSDLQPAGADGDSDSEGLLSVIVPAYNEAARIGPTLRDMAAYLADTGLRAEVIVVDDGSSDNTVEIVAAEADRFACLEVLRLHQNQGKGAAVRAGMMSARGELRLLMDADNATALDQVDVLIQAAATTPQASIAVGSIAAGATDVRQRQPTLRRMLGRLGNLASQAAVIPGVRDTQRGFKLFTAEAAEAGFGPMQSSRWLFDVEALARARNQGHRIIEVPIRWTHMDGGQIRADSYLSSLKELARIAVRLTTERVGLTQTEVAEVEGDMITVSNPPMTAWPNGSENREPSNSRKTKSRGVRHHAT